MPKNLKNIFLMILTIFIFIFVLSSCNEVKINVDINGGTETEKKEASFVAPTIIESLFYNGENQDLINEGTTSEGVFQYKLGTGEYSNNIPKAKEVGTYNVYYKVIGDSTHLDSKEFMLEVNIEKGNPIIVAPTAKTLTYNGLSQQLIVPGTTTGGTLKYKLGTTPYSEEIPEAKEVGTYNIYYKVFGDDNYNNSSENFINVVISSSETKANPVVVAPTAKSLTYNGLAQNLINAGSTTGGTLKYKVDNGTYSTSIPTATNAGTYKIYYKVEGNDNYNDVLEASINVTISKATPVITKPTAKELTYTGDALELINAGSTTGGTLKYKLENGTYSTSIPKAKEEGSYKIYYKVEGNDNYNDVDPQEIIVYIVLAGGKKTPSYEVPSAKTLTYNGLSQNLINAGSTTGGTLKYKLEDGTYSTSIPTAINAGTYTVYYKIEGNDEYNDIEEASINVTISKATPNVVAPTAKTLNYTGDSLVLINEGSTDFGVLLYKLDSNEYTDDIPEAIAEGTYTVYYKVIGRDNWNEYVEHSISVIINPENTSSINIDSLVGGNETAIVSFGVPTNTENDDYNVYYSTSNDNSTFTNEIDKELIFIDGTKATAYIVGLEAGTYYIKVENATDPSDYVISNLVSVSKQDRSGYAHFNYTNGVGAYNDNGTLKTGAKIIYVSDATKNTVTYGSYVGLVDILSNLKSIGGPIVIRFLDMVKTTQWDAKAYTEARKSEALENAVLADYGSTVASSGKYYIDKLLAAGANTINTDLALGITTLNGLEKYSYGTSTDSYWNMCEISSASNVTVEGIGENAGLYQWGLTWKSCSSIEVRNLTFDKYTEDACSFEGSTSSENLTDYKEVGRIWVHNNTFTQGLNRWDVSDDQDKHEGDGATDFKRTGNITLAYNHYIENHKTGLIGSDDNIYTANVTFHHNYYENCNSRMPLGRNANMHMYNNYYYGTTGTNMSIRARGYAFVENCVLENCKNPFECLAGKADKGMSDYTGAVKSLNNQLTNCSGKNNATEVTSRTATVSNFNSYGQTFDTDSSIFYYDSTNQKSDVDILLDTENVIEFVLNHAGAGNNYYVSLELNTNVVKKNVTFHYLNEAGTEIKTQTVSQVVEGSSISRPTNLTVSGYELVDWYTTSEFITEFDFTTAITDDIDIYAKFRELSQYTISYKYNNGSGDVLIDSDTYYENEETIKPSNPTLSGYKFVDWYTNTSYTTKYEFGNCLNDNITIYAKFEEKTVSSSYSISFNNSDTTSSVVTDTTIEVENGTIIAGSGGIKIIAGTTTCGDFTSTKYLDLQGGGSTTNRTLKFELSTTSDITVYFGNSAGRTLNLSDGTSVIGSATTISGVKSEVFEDVPAGTYYLYSGGSGIKIYYVIVEESSGSSTPSSTTSITMNGTSYDTIAAALAAVPTSGSDTYKILLGKGTYSENGLSYNGSATVVISGDTDAQYGADVIIRGHGSDMTNESTRNLITFKGSGNIILENLTLESDWSRADHSGDVQAEVLGTSNTGYTAAYNCSFKSHQDTIRTTGKAWFYGCLIEGDVDFIWMEESGIVALYENCEIVSVYDTNATNHSSYVVAPRMTVGENVGKGVVIYNSTITEENSSQTTYLARTPWSSGYYNQAAFINTTCTGVETAAWYNASITTTYPKTVIGWKMDSETASSIGYTATDDVLDSTIVTNEFSGRKAILNRIYNTTSGAYKKDATGYWDIDSFITTMGWTVASDTSSDLLDGENEIEVITYNFNGSTTGIGTVYSFTGNIEKTNGTIGDIAVNATNGKFAYNSAGYTQFNQNTTLTFAVTAASTITIHSYPGYYNYGVSINGGAQTAATGNDYSFDVAANDTIVITATSTAYLYNLVISGK